MGLFSRIWNKITSWVADRIRDAVDWIVTGLDWLRKQISYWKHILIKKLAEWLEDDVNFLLFVAALIVGAFFVPQALTAIGAALKKTSIAKFIEGLRDDLADWLKDEAHILELSLLHRMLTIFWDDYKNIVNVFNQALASLSEELGYSSGMILSVLFATKIVIQRGAAFTGVDPLLLEYEWYEQTTAFMKRVDDRFLRYTYEPGRFMEDIIEEFVIPYATNYHDNEAAFMESIQISYFEARDKINELEAFRESIDLWIEALPDEIERQFDKRWHPISDYLKERYDLLNENFLMKWDEAFSAINQYERRVNDINDRIAEEQKLLAETLQPEDVLFPILQRDLFDDYSIRAGISEFEDSVLYGAFAEIEDAGFQIIKDGLKIGVEPIPILELEQSMFHRPTGRHKKYDSWNIGDF